MMADAEGMELLRWLCQIRQWVLDKDPRAQPYIDGDAIKITDEGDVAFHRQNFERVLTALTALKDVDDGLSHPN